MTIEPPAPTATGLPARSGDGTTEDYIWRYTLRSLGGGIVDIEFLAQMLQLKHARDNPRLRAANTLSALGELHGAGLLSDEDHEFFQQSYRLLRTIEGRLR